MTGRRRLSKRKLLDWLKDRQNHRNVLVGAIYAGLITRIADGQFDEDERDT